MFELKPGILFAMKTIRDNHRLSKRTLIRKYSKGVMINIASIMTIASSFEKEIIIEGMKIHEHFKSSLIYFYADSPVGIKRNIENLQYNDHDWDMTVKLIKRILLDKYNIPEENQEDFNKFIEILKWIKNDMSEIEFPSYPPLKTLSAKEFNDSHQIMCELKYYIKNEYLKLF